MADISSYTCTGTVVQDPVLKQVNGGDLLSFVIAVDSWKQDEKGMYVDCSVWGNRAKSISGFLSKGSKVSVTGDLRMSQYTGRDGTTKQRLRLSVSDLVTTGKAHYKQKPDEPIDEQTIAAVSKVFDGVVVSNTGTGGNPAKTQDKSSADFFPDDIPF